MVLKKKPGFYVLLLVLFCMLFLGGFSGSCKAYTGDTASVGFNIATDNRIVDQTNMARIINKLNLEDAFSGDFLINKATNLMNTWARTIYANNQEPFGLQDLYFFRQSQNSGTYNIGIVICQDSGHYYKWLYFTGTGGNGNAIANNAYNCVIYDFNGFNYDVNSNIKSANVSNLQSWTLSYNPTTDIGTFTSNNGGSTYQNWTSLTDRKYLSGDIRLGTTEVIYDFSSMFKMHKYNTTDISLSHIAGHTLKYGYDFGRYANYLDIVPYNADSGDTPTPTPTPTPSGGGGGSSTDLTETNSLISNIEDAITEDFSFSGESLSSGDIIDALNVNTMSDPYQNVWTFLISGLSDALLGVNREITFDFLNREYTINLDNIGWTYPVRIFLTLQMFSTAIMVWVLIKFWHEITVKFQSGDIDSVLLESSEEGIVNLF